jgi:AP-2 complex subunit mu-1
VNAALVYELIYKFIEIFKAYFNKLNIQTVIENFAVIYELIDEVCDFGYPQITEPDILRTFITTQGLKKMEVKQVSEIMKQVTGVVSWRKPGIKYRKNEVFLDVIESLNILMSKKGVVLNSMVNGKILMKSYLSGMPDCRFGLNDKLSIKNTKSSGMRRSKEIDIDDVTFHQCVKLGKFESDRSISFIPPDGEFELMKYRITNNLVPPFRLISPIVKEVSKTRLEVRVTIKSVFNHRLFGKNVIVKIPLPPNTAKCSLRVGAGSAKYKATRSAIIWKINRFPGNTEYSLDGKVELIAHTLENKAWNRPPINLSFNVPMFTASGLHVRYLKVYEPKENYQTIKWVRYITNAGNYEIRI